MRISIDRPEIPDGYGLPTTDEGLLDWAVVAAELETASQYWMATTRPDGRPHVVPRWGVWLNNSLWYDGAPTTTHATNLRTNGHCVLHLEDGWRAVIVEGVSGPSESPGLDLGDQIATAISAKYADKGYSPTADSWEGEDAGGLCRFLPSKAMAWFDFPTDMTRFRFDSS